MSPHHTFTIKCGVFSAESSSKHSTLGQKWGMGSGYDWARLYQVNGLKCAGSGWNIYIEVDTEKD